MTHKKHKKIDKNTIRELIWSLKNIIFEISKKFWFKKNKLIKAINLIIKKFTLHILEKNSITKKPINSLRIEKGS